MVNNRATGDDRLLKCEICGKEIENSQYHGNILCSSRCFTINFWREIIAEKDKHIIIHGECYCDGGENAPGAFRGFSGRRFWIRFKDGSTLTTNNLWYQGKITDEFRDELPDTAEFYTPDHIKFVNSLKNPF